MLYKVYEYCIFIPCLSSEVGLDGFRERWLVGTGDFPIKNKYLPTLNRAPLQPGLWIRLPIVFFVGSSSVFVGSGDFLNVQM